MNNKYLIAGAIVLVVVVVIVLVVVLRKKKERLDCAPNGVCFRPLNGVQLGTSIATNDANNPYILFAPGNPVHPVANYNAALALCANNAACQAVYYSNNNCYMFKSHPTSNPNVVWQKPADGAQSALRV